MSFAKDYLSFLFGNKRGQSYRLPQDLNWGSQSFEELKKQDSAPTLEDLLCYHSLNHTLDKFTSQLSLKELSKKEIYRLFTFENLLADEFILDLINHYPTHYRFYKSALETKTLNSKEVEDLLSFDNKKLTIFAIFGNSRSKPGTLLIRKSDGEFLRDKSGKVFKLTIFGNSTRGLDFRFSNGRTPTGVFRVRGVMPEANHVREFGKFRRLKIDYIEDLAESFLPKSHYQLNWFKEATLAHILGRSLFRIHGTGRPNFNILSPKFGLATSSGCLVTRELKGLFNDQRHLLDALMKAQGLRVSYENETNIDSLLYVINFDGKLRHIKFNS